MPQITLTLSDEEYQKYQTGLASLRAIQADHPRAKLLIIFNSPISHKSIPMVRVPLPEPDSEGLVDGWSSPAHKSFCRQAIRQANQILKLATEE
jgi:hypothetical protein